MQWCAMVHSITLSVKYTKRLWRAPLHSHRYESWKVEFLFFHNESAWTFFAFCPRCLNLFEYVLQRFEDIANPHNAHCPSCVVSFASCKPAACVDSVKNPLRFKSVNTSIKLLPLLPCVVSALLVARTQILKNALERSKSGRCTSVGLRGSPGVWYREGGGSLD